MEFWSKGLGEQTIALSLTESEPLKSEGMLYLKGRMEEPVSWEYIMRLSEDDMLDFFALLKEPAVADHLFESPNRWRLYREMVIGGLRLALLVLAVGLRRLLGREAQEEEVAIQVPPVAERRRRRPGRRRLGAKAGSAPPAQPEEESEDPAETRSASGRG
jgi:hypothetical protein